MQKLRRPDFLKKFNLTIPSFKNYEEVKKMDAPLIANGLSDFMKLRLPTWQLSEKSIEKKFEFQDFKKTFGFIKFFSKSCEMAKTTTFWKFDLANIYERSCSNR